MGSTNRPPRRARSSKVSYAYSCSEDEDEDFSVAHEPIPSKASESKDFTRRNLALKRVSRSQEKAEAFQIQKAIEQSLSHGEVKENASRVLFNGVQDSKEVDDSEEDAQDVRYMDHNQEESKSLLSEDCPQERGMPIPSNGTIHGDDTSTGQVVVYSSRQKKTEALNIDTKRSKLAEEEDVDWSCEDDNNGDDDNGSNENVTEDESSDSSEDSGHKRKGPAKSQQRGEKVVGITGKEQKSLTAPIKRPRSSRAVPEAGAHLTSEKRQGIGIKPLVHTRLADCKDVMRNSSSIESKRKHVGTSRESNEFGKQGVPLKQSPLVAAKKHAVHSNAQKINTSPGETPGILAFAGQSPTGLHRRVIGLSRRFKPPPLHPYLQRMES
ncbi:hypothetical protein GOP47_0015425 [Adiantum capillus-veneris]|uniref:Uncharacterized protein n=1 Tax=Adiantum capillus-veneris TaxID=13818 RepID=A0A9D4UJN5_ADICA|nr:hypothetical protein GOP47_0015425 [Adiantum capillus-veneris]